MKLDAFEGPMDLLMHLIEKNKIDIYDIPIAVLTQQYMEYLNRFKEFNLEIASEFLVMASTLLLISIFGIIIITTAATSANIPIIKSLIVSLLLLLANLIISIIAIIPNTNATTHFIMLSIIAVI